jgi:hypothetical protein
MVVIGKEMRAAVRYVEEQEAGVQSYPWHYSEAECLMAGDYTRWDFNDMCDEDALGILPPIGYKDGEAL